MSNRILGIDPGITGALALLDMDTRELIEVLDMPTITVKRGSSAKREVSAGILSNQIRRWKPDGAVIEKVGAMPGQGPASMFAFGRSVGLLEGVLACQHVPVRYITSMEWKRKVGIPTGAPKDESRAKVLQLLPQHAELFERKKDHGRADAVLIAAAYHDWTGF